MKKNVLVFGLLSGLTVCVFGLIAMAINQHRDYDLGMILGYTSMLLAFSFVFVGVKNYRDKYNEGLISFGKAFQVGILIALISSTFYVISWLISYYCFMPDFMDDYAKHSIETMQAAGASQVEIDATMAQMASYKEMYKNPIWVILLTYMEIVPVGLLATLITSLILMKKQKLSTN